MGFLRFVLTGEMDDKPKEGEVKEEKPVEEKPAPQIAAGKSYSPKDFMTLIAEDDPVYHRNFATGEFSQNREQLTKKLEEIINEKKKKGETFNRDNISKLARELASGDRISQLLAKAINNKLQ
jgi:hypothetical protein